MCAIDTTDKIVTLVCFVPIFFLVYIFSKNARNLSKLYIIWYSKERQRRLPPQVLEAAEMFRYLMLRFVFPLFSVVWFCFVVASECGISLQDYLSLVP